MSDDVADNLANSWATHITRDDVARRSLVTTNIPQCNDEFIDNLNHACNPFSFWSSHASGSVANKNAVDEVVAVTQGAVTTNCFATACGSYVSGNRGSFQAYTTLAFDEQKLFAMIAKPAKTTDEAKKTTLPFPYTIINNSKGYSKRIRKLENECLMEIHSRCITSIISGRPIKVILLELMLGGSGGMLRDIFLKKLGCIAKELDIFFVVDEILTCGRTKSFLLSQQTPIEFRSRIHSITIGKWMGLGIILKQFHVDFGESVASGIRGESTTIDLRHALVAVKHVVEHLDSISSIRKKVLTCLKLKNEECWGTGLLIYGPKKLGENLPALKCRYTPLLENSVEIDFRGARRTIPNLKVDTDKQIHLLVVDWLDHSKKLAQYRRSREVVEILCANDAAPKNITENMSACDSLFPGRTPNQKKEWINVLKIIDEKKLLVHKQIGKKRKRVLQPSDKLDMTLLLKKYGH